MEKRIKGKRFNTDNANKLASVTRGSGGSRFTENLYISPRGDYFLHGKGGPLTRWNGEGIVSISIETAQHWMQKYDK